MPFVGQGVGRSSAGFTQKEQSRVIEEFKKGGYNTLVSTCIGEEGLDIGEVDLIICFDAQASPTRMVQRMGRTGRKRDGRCGTTSTTLHSWAFAPPPSVRSQTDDWGGGTTSVVLVTEGAEEAVFKKSQQTSKSINTKIMKPESFALYKECPRMVGTTVHSKCCGRWW
jgi:Fanconi anemia group M protein